MQIQKVIESNKILKQERSAVFKFEKREEEISFNVDKVSQK